MQQQQFRQSTFRHARPPKRRRPARGWYVGLAAVLLLAGVSFCLLRGGPAANTKKVVAAHPASAKPAAAINYCAGNTSGQNVIVSINKRHLWACDGDDQLYQSPVVTGMENLAADLTPVGSYHIYGKQTDLHLKGSDSTGSWDDPVSYWMPFLDNQYGAYGFHDATWRKNSDFGAISPYSSNASHGCVELPLATAKWLYGWAQIGTMVTIES